jgi:F-type H+-transporting ATPase subunit b
MDINLTLVIQGLAFFAVAWLVMKFGWPHIMAAIEERQQKIAEGLAAADRSQKDLAQAEEKVNELR